MTIPKGGPTASVFRVHDSSQVGEVRRGGEALASSIGMTDVERGALSIVVTELATNLVRHARNGRILLSPLFSGNTRAGVEIVSIDDGPGIAHVGRALEDGYSTAGTSGHGLGAVQRMAHEFDMYSRIGEKAGAGTLVRTALWTSQSLREAATSRPLTEFGAVCTSFDNGPICGDAWLVVESRTRVLVAVADGLGHGPEAAVASTEAIRVIRENSSSTPGEILDRAHGALRATRGAACGIVAVDLTQGIAHFAGIGNITVALHSVDGSSRSFASLNGTVGHAIRKIHEFQYPWPEDGLLVLHSDGITSRWRLDNYPGLTQHHPSLVAGAVFRDALRGRDDATIVALRKRQS